ncbi:SGNH/GDSL hydrolase family protein [Microbacterium sp. AG1240]|uniref:SGNH/GDSL hydrolase family protein n=1 Tax=Microbacterium sp. AG1240 TaxID=2183992 RepID=UPI0015FFB7F7|nr:SGNH/GDSL hydrolase family protein [Microbacterium sp. AG1240]
MNNDPTKPLSATRLNKLETQYDEAISQVATDVANDASAIGGALSAKIDAVVAPIVAGGSALDRYAGDGIAALGDSITANYGNSTTTATDGHVTYGLLAAGAPVSFRGAFAAGGRTIQQLVSEGFVDQILALSPLPAVVHVLAGTNNLPTLRLARDLADYASICDTFAAAGIRVIVCAVPLRADSTAANAQADVWNRALLRFAGKCGYDFVAYNETLTDPATGLFRTALAQTDNVHPSYLGTKRMGAKLGPVLSRMFRNLVPPLPTRAGEIGNLLGVTGMFLTDSKNGGNEIAGDGIADGWRRFGTSTVTFTRTTDSDGYGHQLVSIDAGSGGTINLQTNIADATSSAFPGDIVEFCAKIKTTGFEANLVAPSTSGSGGTGPAYSLVVDYNTSTGYKSLIRGPYSMHADCDGAFWAKVVVPSDATGDLRVSIQTVGAPATATITMDISRMALRNLTALASDRVVVDAAMTSGAATLTSATAAFTAADVGKKIRVRGAGGTNVTLVTTIAAYNSATQVTLATNAAATVSAATAYIAPGATPTP